jgi:hypothetical protein
MGLFDTPLFLFVFSSLERVSHELDFYSNNQKIKVGW